MFMLPVTEFYAICQVNTCQHGGSCYLIAGLAICFCDQNYIGDKCEGMYNVCTSLLNDCASRVILNELLDVYVAKQYRHKIYLNKSNSLKVIVGI